MWDSKETAGTHCPVLLLREWQEVLMAHSWAERGFLPVSGGWANQHAAFVDAVDVVRVQARRIEDERARQVRAQSEE